MQLQERPDKMIVSPNMELGFAHTSRRKTGRKLHMCPLELQINIWCFGLREKALEKESCLRETLNEGVIIEECYEEIKEPETEIKDIDPYLNSNQSY